MAKNVPDIYDLVKNWTDYGQNPKIYEKLISLLKVAPIDKKVFDKLINRAQAFDLNSEAEEFKQIMNTRVLRLAQSKLPSDWLTLYRFNYKNSDAVYKIIEYLLMRYERGAPERLLRYIDNFMNTNRNIPRFTMLDLLYAKKVGNRGYEDGYWDLCMIGEINVIRNLLNLDQVLIDECKKACEEKSPYAYLLCELAVAFSPSFKPPKCPPRPKTANAKPQNAASLLGKSYTSQSFGLNSGFSNTYTTSTYSGTSSFKYTDEERQRAQEIISEAAAQKDAEIYVAYLLGDIDAPSNLDSLVEKFSGIDWSEHGDV